MIRLSYSAMKAYLECPKKYEYSRRLTKDMFNFNFFVGNCIHEGMRMTYTGQKDIFNVFGKHVDDYIELQRKAHFFSPEGEQKLEEWRVIMLGMVFAYNNKYMEHIDNMSHIRNEAEYLVDITNDIKFLIKIDNILADKKTGRKFIHEIKTSRELTDNYVYKIQMDLQTSIYYHLGRMVPDFMPDGVIYDVLQKPSIKVKTTEEYKDYLHRLQAYYEVDPNAHLHMEFIDKPLINKGDLIANITDTGYRIQRSVYTGYFNKNQINCEFCDFKKLCLDGDQPEDLMSFKVVERDSNGNRIIT